MNSLQINANAKINLGLLVKFKREDGFHEIESIFQEIDFGDEIILKPNHGISFTTNSDELKTEKNNSCIQAAGILMREFSIDGLSIELNKKIPIGAGLGGGSSDAMAVLKGGIKLYQSQIEDETISCFAAQLGSDVSFFLRGKTAHVSGRGEIIQPIKIGLKYYVLLVMPGLKISTLWAYKSLGMHLTKKDNDYKFKSSNLLGLTIGSLKKIFHNDFEKSIFDAHPELANIKDLLYSEKADFSCLSGSGSTVFGIFSTLQQAKQAGRELSKKYNCIIAKPIY